MDFEDEYVRDFAFDPEFIRRKDSIEMHRDRIEKRHKCNKRRSFMRKFHSDKAHKSFSSSDEEIAIKFKKNIIDAEVYSFCTVNSLSAIPKK